MLSVFFWNVGNRKPDQTMVWTKCGLSSHVTVSGLGSLWLMWRLPGFRLLVQPSYHVAFILIFIVLVGSLAAPYSPSLLQAGGKSRVKVEVEMPVEPTPKKPNPASLLLARVSHSHSYFENTGVLFWSWMYFYPEPDQGSLVTSGELSFGQAANSEFSVKVSKGMSPTRHDCLHQVGCVMSLSVLLLPWLHLRSTGQASVRNIMRIF